MEEEKRKKRKKDEKREARIITTDVTSLQVLVLVEV
jgi:hypothetical protein